MRWINGDINGRNLLKIETKLKAKKGDARDLKHVPKQKDESKLCYSSFSSRTVISSFTHYALSVKTFILVLVLSFMVVAL